MHQLLLHANKAFLAFKVTTTRQKADSARISMEDINVDTTTGTGGDIAY